MDAVKFSLVFRGYKASEVDWVLDRLARQIDDLRAELDEVRVARDNVDANAE
ncbi:DivIVA domain protein [Mycobacteroides abscessus subsp. abscessus]|nr:DivIVA domain protein [Mycobacteroides abscessus subsp. abscessus]